MADQESLLKIRNYAQSLQGEERATFIEKFKALKGDDKIVKLASRLPDIAKPEEASPLDSVAKNIPQLAGTGAVKDVGIEVLRGFQQGGESMMRNADSVAQMMANAVGKPELSSGTFGEIADQIKVANEKYIPKTNLPQGVKDSAQAVGALPAVVSEFLLTRKGLSSLPGVRALQKNPGVNEVTDAVSAGVQSAVSSFKNSPQYGDMLESFASGTNLGLMFSVAPEAVKIGKVLGRQGAYAFVKAVTGDEATALAYVKDPWKFNLNPFSKVKSLSEVTKENQATLNDMRTKMTNELSDESIRISEKKSQFANDVDSKVGEVKARNRETLNSLKSKGEFDVAESSRKSSESHSVATESIKQSLDNDFMSSVNKLELIRRGVGGEVNQAIENVINKDPFSRVKSSHVLDRFEEFANKHGFEIKFSTRLKPAPEGDLMNSTPQVEIGEPVLVPKFGAGSASKEVEQLLKENLDDILQFSRSGSPDGGEIPLGYLQGKKARLQESGYSGHSELNHAQKGLAKVLNPVEMRDNIVGKNIEPELAQLAKSNKEYSEFVPRYEEALKNYSKAGADGKAVPDFTRAINAIRRGDKATIRQMAKADKGLPEADRLLPKVEKAVSELNRLDDIHLSTIKLAKRKASQDLAKLKTEISQKEFNLRIATRENKQALARDLRRDLNKLREAKQTKLTETMKKLDAEEEFLRQQNSLRSFVGAGRAGQVQAAGVAGLVANAYRPNPLTATMGAVATAGPSPVIGANILKQLSRLSGPADALAGVVLGAKKRIYGS